MIGGQIGDQRPLGAALHVHELEGAELHHGEVLLSHLAAQGQQGRADVAPQPDGLPGGLQHFADQSGGGGLAVGTGDGDQVAGANLKEHLHLRGNPGPTAFQGLNGRVPGVHSGGAEDHVRLDSV